MQRLTPSRGRRQFALARALQRRCCRVYAAECSPRDWRFRAATTAARPSRRRSIAAGLHFNIAHTARMWWSWPCAGMPRVRRRCRNARHGAPLAVARALFFRAEAARCARCPPTLSPALPAAVDTEGGVSEGHRHRDRRWPRQHDVSVRDAPELSLRARRRSRTRRAGNFGQFDSRRGTRAGARRIAARSAMRRLEVHGCAGSAPQAELAASEVSPSGQEQRAQP